MQDNEQLQEKDERPILELIQKIKDGSFEPRLLSKEERLQCVEILLGEGMSESAIAQALKRNEKTIQRDLSDIRQRNAVVPNIELAKQIVGELLTNARIHHAYLMRIARNKESSASDKIQAESSAWHVMKELADSLQGLGYLPSRPTTIVGDIFYHKEDADTSSVLDDINKQIIDVEGMMTETNVITQAVREEIRQVKGIVDEVKATKDAKKEAPNDNTKQQ